MERERDNVDRDRESVSGRKREVIKISVFM